jgi:hypothetical protein
MSNGFASGKGTVSLRRYLEGFNPKISFILYKRERHAIISPMDVKNFSREKQTQARASNAPAPPSIPDNKKTVYPFFFFVGLGIVGFCVAAALFAFFSRTHANKIPSLPVSKNIINETTVMPQASLSALEKRAVAPSAEVVPQKAIAPSPEQETSLPTLTLSGIVFGQTGSSFALINGKIVPEGSFIEGAKVEKISSDTVELSFGEKRIVLRSR